MTDTPPLTDDLFESAPCGYALIGDDGLFTRVNAEFRRLTGRASDDLLGRADLSAVFAVGGRLFLQTHLWPMLEHDGSVREVALDVLRPDGSRVPVLFSADADSSSTRGTGIRVVVIETRERHRYEQDLLSATRDAERARLEATALANTLQRTLIPPLPPRIPLLTVSAAYQPAGDGSVVGGDFYDIFQVGPQRWWIVLGDVSGKGVSAATVTSFVRYTVRALAIDHPDPSELLRHLDHAMHLDATEHYCTLIIARLTRSAPHWEMELALAGHPPAVVRDRDGHVRELGTFGTPVGLVDQPSFTTIHHLLQDEIITFYTDGVTEARGTQGMYGETRLRELVAGLPHDPHAITEAISRDVVGYQDGALSDDVAIVTFATDPTASGPGSTR